MNSAMYLLLIGEDRMQAALLRGPTWSTDNAAPGPVLQGKGQGGMGR